MGGAWLDSLESGILVSVCEGYAWRKAMGKKSGKAHPKVFISYSHDSAEHADKVLVFADKLRADRMSRH